MKLNRISVIILVIIIVVFAIGFFKYQKEDKILVDLDIPFKLKIGQEAFVEKENIKIKFLNITEDSRCPMDVVCVWGGEVSVLVNIVKNNQNIGNLVFTKKVTTENLESEIDKEYSIKLIKVEPYPISKQKIEDSDYVITLLLSKLK